MIGDLDVRDRTGAADRARLRRVLGRTDTVCFLLSAMIVTDTIGAVATGGGQAFTWLVVRAGRGLPAVAGLGTAHPDTHLPAGFAGQRGLFELLVPAPVAVIVTAATAYCLATRYRNPSPSHREE